MSDNSLVFSPEVANQLVRDTMPLGYLFWDAKGNGLDCSPSVIHLFGLETSQDVFGNWDRLSPPIQPNGYSSKILFEELLSLVSVHGKAIAEWQHQTIYGEQIPVEVTCIRHSFNDNDFIISYLRDLRESKQTHQDSSTGHLRLASILRSCPICFALLSEDRFTFITPFMHNFLGVKVGDTFSSLFADPQMAEKLNKELNENDLISWMPVKIHTCLGEVKEMLAYSLCFDDTGHEIPERIIWLVDITQSRKFENELKAAKELAEASTKAKSEFLANMSHEIRTPMNAIIGLTHLILRSSLTKQQAEYVETVQQSAQILLRIINDILDFSKIEAGRMILEYREFAIESVISELSAVISVPVQKKNLKFQIEVDNKLPPTVMGDSVRLHQVTLNLLTNAVKFTEKGWIRLNVEVVEMDFLSIVVRFSVTDSGIGMTPVQVKGLFQPFSQASASTTRQFGGTGLGLAISRRFVELMHGEISCQSKQGKGSTFSFTARFGIPLKGEVVTVDESTKIRTDALLVGDYDQEQATMRHYIELLESKAYQVGAELSDFKNVLDTEKIKEIDFIVFDFFDLQKNLVPFYNLLREKRLNPMPVCVVVEHPELESILDNLGIKDSVHILKKPVVAGELFKVVAKVAHYKERLRQEKMTKEQSANHSSQNINIPDSIRGAKILLAEDNKINQLVATELLKVEGFETTVANNGRIAIELLKEQKFDVILMDVQMPEMDGFEATRVIRADPKFNHIPILAMTANAMSEDRELCLEAGMDDYIAKPIEPTVLYSALVKWLRK